MSDTHNHILCAERALTQFNETARNAVEKHPYAFFLGSQGGDIYLYYEPQKGERSWAATLADILHNDIDEIMLCFSDVLGRAKDDDRSIMLAYCCGFITHHALDNRTHPFIEARRGDLTHKRFEVLLDVAYADDFGLDLKQIKLPEEETNVYSPVTELHNAVFMQTLKQSVPESFVCKCALAYHRAVRLTEKPFFRVVAGTLGLFHKGYAVLTDAFFIPDKDNDVKKFLNNENCGWRNPKNENEFFTLSYPQLFSYAVNDSVKRVKRFCECIDRKPTNAIMNRIFAGLSF